MMLYWLDGNNLKNMSLGLDLRNGWLAVGRSWSWLLWVGFELCGRKRFRWDLDIEEYGVDV